MTCYYEYVACSMVYLKERGLRLNAHDFDFLAMYSFCDQNQIIFSSRIFHLIFRKELHLVYIKIYNVLVDIIP